MSKMTLMPDGRMFVDGGRMGVVAVKEDPLDSDHDLAGLAAGVR